MTRLKIHTEGLKQVGAMDGDQDDDGEADDEEEEEDEDEEAEEEKQPEQTDDGGERKKEVKDQDETGDCTGNEIDEVDLVPCERDSNSIEPSPSPPTSFPVLASTSVDSASGDTFTFSAHKSDSGQQLDNQNEAITKGQSSDSSEKEKKVGEEEGNDNDSESDDPNMPTLEAKEIYILMSKEYRISRNRRAEWFFSKVNTRVKFPADEKGDFGEDEEEDGEVKRKGLDNGSSDFEVVSIIPSPSKLHPEWTFENRHAYKYNVNPDTVITYLSRRYRIVFCLDISPSVASVDVQAGGVVFDSIFKALQTSLHGLLQPFQIPGSKRTFRPEIFLTVIAHTPFFTPVADQILIQGQMLDKETCSSIIKHIFDKLNDIENRIARLISKRVHQLRLANGFGFDVYTNDDDDEVDGVVLEPEIQPNGEGPKLNGLPYRHNSKYTSFSMSPDFGLLDLLRQALIAMSLMPENSSAGLVILTDGVISVPDGRYLDIILSQLRYNTVSCSFIQLSSPFHPHLCHGVIPYADLMKFIASATFGAFLSEAPEINDKTVAGMNVYHNAFLAWSFHKTMETEWTNPRPPAFVKPGEWSVRNKVFFSVRDMPIVKKQQYENTLNVDHMKVMSCRLREGFTIKEVITLPDTGLSEVTLILPWKFLIHLEYKILINSRDYPFDDMRLDEVNESGYPSRVKCVVSLEGPYDFLHDVTCLAKKPFSSLYRQLMVNRFWATRKNLSESDRLLVHLNSFSTNTYYYNIPESIRNGLPLFYWSAATSTASPQLHSNETGFPSFAHFWKPVCLLDTTVWQKWMHTHRIGVILEHDYPLPKNLHLPNSTGRFNVIQCRQAVMALNTLLKNMSSFVLLENQSYVQLMFKNEDDKIPHSFCLIRVTSKPPHVVLRLAFLVGTPGHLRHRTVAQFREKITHLTFPQRVKDPPRWRVIINTPNIMKAGTKPSTLVTKTSWSDMPCCLIVHKPVEKILIRYDKSPEDFLKRLLSREKTSQTVPEGKSGQPRQSTFGFRPVHQTQSVGNTSGSQMLPEVFNTIARYLHHKRWIWWFPGGDLPPLNVKWASEILATVTKIRLQEGFRFAYSSAGITNMVLELPMANESSKKNTVTPMVLQFLVFPPTPHLSSDHEELESMDASNSLFLVTECWVEPQFGKVTNESLENISVVSKSFLSLDYTAIPKLLQETDHKCISLVGTFEYLVRICTHKDGPFLISVNQPTTDIPLVEEHETIEVVPFEFDLKQILMRSAQVEILLSSFYQDLSLTFPNEWNINVCNFFERGNTTLYQQWCQIVASFQDKEVSLTPEQHEVATRSILHRKGFDDSLDDDVVITTPATTKSKKHGQSQQQPPQRQRQPSWPKGKGIQWRCFVRSNSSTHVVVTLVPASLKDMKQLLLHLDPHMESLHKTKSSRYVDFYDFDYASAAESGMECPNQLGVVSTGGGTAPVVASSASSSSSPHLYDHHQQNCRNCQQKMDAAVAAASRKRVRAFSGGNECAPVTKKSLVTPSQTHHHHHHLHHHQSLDHAPQTEEELFQQSNTEGRLSPKKEEEPLKAADVEGKDEDKEEEESAGVAAAVRSQTFSEGTASGKLAQIIKAKRTLSDHSTGAGQDQDKFCSDPQRCLQLNEFLNRCGHGNTGQAATDPDNLRYVPCRPPVVGSLAYCIFTYSCSLMSLTDHVVYKKLNIEETSKDYRMIKTGLLGMDEFDMDTGDDDDESSESGSLVKNGRSISQESFSESSLQRLEAAEHESMLKSHCSQMKQVHQQAYIWSAYKSLLSGYPMHPCDIEMVIKKCSLSRVRFPLQDFLQHVCRHDKELKEILCQLEDEDEENDKEEEVDVDRKSDEGDNGVCRDLQAIHKFIEKRFRRLLSRNFSPAMQNGHILFYKVLGSNALSDVSGIKCSSDFDDNLDTCSIAADSLCSMDQDPYHISYIQNLPQPPIPMSEVDFERSPAPTRSATATHLDDQQSCGGTTLGGSIPVGGSISGGGLSLVQCAPLFCYVNCNFQTIQKDHEEGEPAGFIPLVDMPTCYYKLCMEYFRTIDSQDPDLDIDVMPSSRFQLDMELTFLTCPDFAASQQQQSVSSPKDGGSSGQSQTSGQSDNQSQQHSNKEMSLTEFKKRVSIRQTRAIDHIIHDIEWLMADEITSFRGGGTGAVDSVDATILQQVANHVEKSLEKPGCQFQQISLSFVDNSEDRSFHSFLDRFDNVKLEEFYFRREDIWWYLVKTDSKSNDNNSPETVTLPPFWIILKSCSSTLLQLYHHCRYDENELSNLIFSRTLRNRVVDLISGLIRTINQDLLLQQLHDTRFCSPLLEVEDCQDLDEISSIDLMMMGPSGSASKFALQMGLDSELDMSATSQPPLPSNFNPGMFSCQVVWGTTFTLHSRLRSGGGKTAFSRGIQTLRSTLTAFEVANRRNMFVYRDATGNVFYMRFYRGLDVLEASSSSNSPSKMATDINGSGGDELLDPEQIVMKRVRNNDSESEKTGRDDQFDGILSLKVHGIVPAGEEIKEKLVQSLKNKLDDAVLDILSVTLKRNPHCKLTPEDVHFLQEPRSRPDSLFRFKLTEFIVSGHLPAFSYYLHQNLLQFLSIPKYTSQKPKYHFQDYSRLPEDGGDWNNGTGEQSSVYLYNQSPGGGGTGNRGIAVVSMALTDKLGRLVSSPEWKQPELGCDCEIGKFYEMIRTDEVSMEEMQCLGEDRTLVEFSMWMQGRINLDLLKSHVEQAIRQAGWDLMMEFKVMTAPLSVVVPFPFEEEVFESEKEVVPTTTGTTQEDSGQIQPPQPAERKRRSSHLNPITTRSNSTGGPIEEDEEPRTRSMSFTGLRKPRTDGESGENEQGRDRAPSPVISGRGAISEGSRPRVLLSRTHSYQMSLTSLETGEVGKLHSNYTELLDTWLESGSGLGAPSLRRITVALNCRYPVQCIVKELEKIINQVAPDNTPRQFWRHGENSDFLTACGPGQCPVSSGVPARRESGGDDSAEYLVLKRNERELLALEDTEEAEYPQKILNLFRGNENFQPGYKGHVCYLIGRNLAHWKSCLNCNAEFSLHSSQDFKNLYKYAPLINENCDIDGSRGSIEKLSRVSFPRDFVLWSRKNRGGRDGDVNEGTGGGGNGHPILIPRQRFIRAKVTCSEVDFVVYNWSKECCERLQEHVTYLSHWIQARASLLNSILLQKSGLFYCQPILPENFTGASLAKNPFIMGDVDLRDLILNNPPTGKHERRNPLSGVSGGGRVKPLIIQPVMKPTQVWRDFYRNIPLCNMLRLPEPIGENPVDGHGRQLLHVLNNQIGESKEKDISFFQYWLTRGPSASNVITTQILESFKQAARTIHFCLTPVMFLPTWRAAVAQTRDSATTGGIIRRNRGSSRRFHQTHSLHPPHSKIGLPTYPNSSALLQLQAQRVRHGSEASQASNFSLRNRSKSYHSGMMNLFLHPETVQERDMEGSPAGSVVMGNHTTSPQIQQQQSLFHNVKTDEPWHGVLCKTFLQEYMQYLTTLGFVPIHCKPGSAVSPGHPGESSGGIGSGGRGGLLNMPGHKSRVSPGLQSPITSPLAASTPTAAAAHQKLLNKPGTPTSAGGNPPGGGNASQLGDGDGEDDEKMIHFLQRCLPGGIIVMEVGLTPPFFYTKIHALEAKRIFPTRHNKIHQGNTNQQKKNAVQFVDECEKMKILTHLHSFMYDFHLRAMYLYISGRQLLFKMGYHITTFLDDFITYYPKCPNFARNAVHIGMITLAEVNTPSQVLFNYILSHDKYYRMRVIRMTPFQGGSVLPEENSSEYVLVHNMSRKVSYRSSERGDGTDLPQESQQTQDEFDLTLVIAHDYPTSSRDFIPDYQGLRVKYYIVLTSRRDLYPKSDSVNEPTNGKLCRVNTPEPLCNRHHANCCQGARVVGGNSGGVGAFHKLVSPPAPPPSYFEGFEGHQHFQNQSLNHNQQQGGPLRHQPQLPDMIKEERVKYMGYFSSHDQLMQRMIEEQKDTMEQFVRQLITKAAVDCRRDLLWQRLLIGRPQSEPPKGKAGKQSRSASASVSPSTLKEDIISRETVGPLYFGDFNELLQLVQVIPLRSVDSRLEGLLHQPVSFYQTLIKVLIGGSCGGLGATGTGSSHHQHQHQQSSSLAHFHYREFISPEQSVHQLALFTQDAHKYIVVVEVNMEKAKCDIYIVFKDGKKQDQQRASQSSEQSGVDSVVAGIPQLGDLGEAIYSLVEKVVNACCYATWTSLI